MASADERQECVRCINPGHIGRNCNVTKTACWVDDCRSSNHHRFLHGAKLALVRLNTDSTLTVNHVRTARGTTTMLSVVPLIFENPDTKVSIRTYSLGAKSSRFS